MRRARRRNAWTSEDDSGRADGSACSADPVRQIGRSTERLWIGRSGLPEKSTRGPLSARSRPYRVRPDADNRLKPGYAIRNE